MARESQITENYRNDNDISVVNNYDNSKLNKHSVLYDDNFNEKSHLEIEVELHKPKD